MFAALSLGHYGLILFRQQGWCMALLFWNRHLTCLAVERFSTHFRQIAKWIHGDNVMRLFIVIAARKFHGCCYSYRLPKKPTAIKANFFFFFSRNYLYTASGAQPRVKSWGGPSWRAREREPIWGSGGFTPSGVQGQSPWWGGQGRSPLKLKPILQLQALISARKLQAIPGCQKLGGGGTGPPVPMVVAPIPSHLGLHGVKPQLQTHFYDFKAYALEAIRFLKFWNLKTKSSVIFCVCVPHSEFWGICAPVIFAHARPGL
jgi:hypothetical protein